MRPAAQDYDSLKSRVFSPKAKAVFTLSSVQCVFCGLKPEEKTKEHVIPRWLIERTGDPDRTAFFGHRWSKKKEGQNPDPHSHAFDQYTFPACKGCNERYAALEGSALMTFDRLSLGQNISSADVEVFLDWFDKVRVGLWLGGRMLGTNIFRPSQPKFFIQNRIGLSDRLLYISRMDMEVGQGLSFFGTSSPLFGSMPSVFGLRANNLMFINASSGGFLAKRLGLPFGQDVRVTHGGKSHFEGQLVAGTGRTTQPLLPFRYPLNALPIFQPMYVKPLHPEIAHLFSSPLAEQYLQDISNLKGRILTVKSRVVEPLHNLGPNEYATMLLPSHPRIPKAFSRAVLELQNVVSKGSFWGGRATIEQEQERRELLAGLRRLNRRLMP